MTDVVATEQDGNADALLGRLREIRKKLGIPEGPQRKALYDERIGIFLRLSDLGVSNRVIGEAFGVGAGAVEQALRSHRRAEGGNPQFRRPPA